MSAADSLSNQFEKPKRPGMISLDLPHGVIPTVPGDVEDRHISIAILGDDVDDVTYKHAASEAKRVAASVKGPLRGTVGGLGSFPPSPHSDGKRPVFAVPDVPGISAIHGALSHLDKSSFSDYKPHVTIKYLEDGDPLPAPIKEKRVEFNSLSIHHGDSVEHFPFGSR